MAAATVWWARTDFFGIGANGIVYDSPSGTLSGRVTGSDRDQSGTFVLMVSYWLPKANYPADGCKFRSTPGANLSGDAFVSALTGSHFLFWETDAPRAQCQLRATQQVFAGPSLVASGALLHDIASCRGDFQSFTGHLPAQPFPTLDFDLDRTQDLGIHLQLSFENKIVHSYQTWWGFPAICSIKLPQWDIVSIA
jgi:hypothetical protein